MKKIILFLALSFAMTVSASNYKCDFIKHGENHLVFHNSTGEHIEQFDIADNGATRYTISFIDQELNVKVRFNIVTPVIKIPTIPNYLRRYRREVGHAIWIEDLTTGIKLSSRGRTTLPISDQSSRIVYDSLTASTIFVLPRGDKMEEIGVKIKCQLWD